MRSGCLRRCLQPRLHFTPGSADKLEGDARWERALLIWGAVALGVVAVGLLCGLPSGFDSGTLFGAIGIVAIVEAVLVLATLVVWMLSN